MKNAVLFFIIFLSLSINAQDLQKLADNRDFITLSQLDIESWAVDDYSIPLLRAHTYSAMTRYEASNKELEFILGIDSVTQNPGTMINILVLQANNYFKNYQYNQAAESYKKILDNYGNLLGEAVVPLQDAYRRYNALSAVKPLQVSVPHDTQINTRPDKKGLPLVQVRTPKDSVSLIFDTGAGMSVVTRSVAERLGIRILADSLIAGGAVNSDFMSIGVADTLYLGDILYTNVVFGIFADEKLTFPEHGYAVNGTFGFPEMKILPSIRIHKNGILEISKNTVKHKSNMMFSSENQIVIQANDSLLFWLDTGAAGGSNLFVNYYNKYKEQVDKKGKPTTKTVNGMGGTQNFSVYQLKDFPIKIDTTTTILPEIPVFIEPTIGWAFEYDGALGQDIISQYDYMLLDFNNMYFSLGNTKPSK